MSAITITKKRVKQINNCHFRIENMGNALLEEALTAGQLLSEAKADLPHGDWMGWVENNLRFTHRTATNYMRIHDLEVAGKLETVSNISEAYQLIKSPPKLAASPASDPAPRSSSAPRSLSAPLVIEAELVESESTPSVSTTPTSSAPSQDEPEDDIEPLIVNGTKEDDVADKPEPLLAAIKQAMPTVDPEPINDAIERLIFILLQRECPASYIDALADSVNHIEKKGASKP